MSPWDLLAWVFVICVVAIALVGTLAIVVGGVRAMRAPAKPAATVVQLPTLPPGGAQRPRSSR